jgi:hypothetical protein
MTVFRNYPDAEYVYSFPSAKDRYCALPVLAGRYRIETLPADHALVSLDVGNPRKPVEVSRVELVRSENSNEEDGSE